LKKPLGVTAFVLFFSAPVVLAAPAPPGGSGEGAELASRLEFIHEQEVTLEQRLLDGARNQKVAQINLKYLRALIKLRKEERELGRKRIAELEKTVGELESRKADLNGKIVERKKYIHQFLEAIQRDSLRLSYSSRSQGPEQEKIEALRRKVLANLVGRGLKELEMVKIDLADAYKLEERIQEERSQLSNLLQDLDEQEGVLRLNQQIQAELLRKNQGERLAQLENYRKLKNAESRVQSLINEFNSRKELERTVEAEQNFARANGHGAFAELKGKLGLPLVGGKILSAFGKAFDPKSRLYVFKKGIEIAGAEGRTQPVQAIYGGKIAFSGELPNYGRVAIVDHGDHFYSLCAHLGTLEKKAGDRVVAGDTLGLTDDSGTPVYFEIRARNVAVNPLQWVSN
jgi:septal ring factor EnvC (AmiA/AmiB activator)